MGHVVGGWEYVWAAYGITWVGLVLFGVSLAIRRMKES
jgi:heme exporter protein D